MGDEVGGVVSEPEGFFAEFFAEADEDEDIHKFSDGKGDERGGGDAGGEVEDCVIGWFGGLESWGWG